MNFTFLPFTAETSKTQNGAATEHPSTFYKVQVNELLRLTHRLEGQEGKEDPTYNNTKEAKWISPACVETVF